MIPIQERNLSGASNETGGIRLTWNLLASDPPDATFFLEHMVNGTWRFPADVTSVDATTFDVVLEGGGSQQLRIIAPDGTPSETLNINLDDV
jgi:hypothetical protein